MENLNLMSYLLGFTIAGIYTIYKEGSNEL
jgi:hypothetical protein